MDLFNLNTGVLLQESHLEWLTWMFREDTKSHGSVFNVVCWSVCGPLADVILDRQLEDPWAVHSSVWSVRVLAVHPRCHRAVGLDAPGTHHHHGQSPGVEPHGKSQRVFLNGSQIVQIQLSVAAGLEWSLLCLCTPYCTKGTVKRQTFYVSCTVCITARYCLYVLVYRLWCFWCVFQSLTVFCTMCHVSCGLQEE